MAVTQYEARGAAREPDGGTPGCIDSFFEYSVERTCMIFNVIPVGWLSGYCRVVLVPGSPYFSTSTENNGATYERYKTCSTTPPAHVC